MTAWNHPEIRELMIKNQPDYDFISANPQPGEEGSNFGYAVGSSLPDMLGGRPILKPAGKFLSALGTNDTSSALMGAAVGGLAGAGFGVMTGKRPLLTSLAGAALGGVTGYGASRLWGMRAAELERQRDQIRAEMRKSSFYMLDSDPLQEIQTKLFADVSLAPGEKASLMGALPSLSQDQLKQLASMVRTATGAGIGALVAKFLMGAGGFGTVALGLLGGAIGHRMGGPRKNMFGQRADPEFNVFGQRYFVV